MPKLPAVPSDSLDSNQRHIQNMVRVAALSDEEQIAEWKAFVDWNATMAMPFNYPRGVHTFSSMAEKNDFEDRLRAEQMATQVLTETGL